MLRVGLTGGIGSGKSTVSGRLAEHGATIIDADRIAREVVEPGSVGLAKVTEAFGDGVIGPDGALDRAALAKVVFADNAARHKLNGIVHPLIGTRTAELTSAAPKDAVLVHDVPLLVENGLGPEYQLVLVVGAPVEERVRRLVRERGMAEQEARDRVAAQADDAARAAAADVLLDNGGERSEVLLAVERLWHDRLVPYEQNLRERRRARRPHRALLVDPDPSWPAQAARAVSRVARVAAGRALRVDHIGSTSVPGLVAKDVLDLQVVVPDLATATAVADDLLDAGLVRRPDIGPDVGMDGRRYPEAFAAGADPGRAVNCHVRPEDSPAWRETLAFRDRLRSDPALAHEYAELKQRLAAAPHDSIDDYAAAKTPFVRRVLGEADREE
jgi:dephospho-CoA kinase